MNDKMPSIVGIITFISMINTTSENMKAKFFFSAISFYDQLNFHAQSFDHEKVL